jgi:hypothetical protein
VEQNDEINLVQAASDGDVDSFNRLCEHYYPAITAIAYSQLFDRGLAEDAGLGLGSFLIPAGFIIRKRCKRKKVKANLN